MHSHADHSHHHHAPAADPFKQVNNLFVIAVLANLAFTILEAIYGFITNSVGLLADAGHNLSDVLGLLLAWGASYLAIQHTSKAYSYGYRKSTILAAVINAVVLILVAGFIAFESIQKFLQPSPIAELVVMVVATIGIFVNAGTALLFLKDSGTDLNARGAYLHLAYDAAVSAGVVIGAGLIMLTGWLWIDPLLGLLIVVVILAGTWGLLRDSVSLIIDAVPQHINQDEVRSYLLNLEGVTAIHDLHIWAMSTRENILTAHLVMPSTSLWEEESGYARVSDALLHRFNIHHVTLQVEKDIKCPTDCD